MGEHLSGLQQLSLAGNNLTHLPPGIGRLTALQRLQLSGNLFETMPEEIGQLSMLQVRACAGLYIHCSTQLQPTATPERRHWPWTWF